MIGKTRADKLHTNGHAGTAEPGIERNRRLLPHIPRHVIDDMFERIHIPLVEGWEEESRRLLEEDDALEEASENEEVFEEDEEEEDGW